MNIPAEINKVEKELQARKLRLYEIQIKGNLAISQADLRNGFDKKYYLGNNSCIRQQIKYCETKLINLIQKKPLTLF